MTNKVVVVGSLNVDLVLRIPRRPEKGETIASDDFRTFVGGKGNNQALAAARAGASVSMIGRVGDDYFGQRILSTLDENAVGCEHVSIDHDTGTGIAVILVDFQGENSIVLAPQANGRLCPEHVRKASALLTAANVLLLQMEISEDCNQIAAAVAHQGATFVILNPAPAPASGKIAKELLAQVDVLVPNQMEAEILSGTTITGPDSAVAVAKTLQRMGPPRVVITMGEAGALLLDKDTAPLLVPAFKVKAVDTTAAGDAFCGAMAAYLAAGRSLAEAAKFGCAAGALATTKNGAEPSLPLRDEIVRLQDEARKLSP